jgi:histone deacetylase complex regulatory component SIN3
MFHGARSCIGLMCCLWIDCSIGVRGIVDRMKVLLRGHPDLKRRFNMFLPPQYKCSLRDDDDSLQGRPAHRD